MWDDAILLKRMTRALLVLALVLAVYGAGRYVMSLPIFPLRAVVLKNVPQRVPLEKIEEVVKRQIRGNFFTVDLQKTREQFEQLPWVRSVSVRRKFPWSLEVEIEERIALGWWNEQEMVDRDGVVFSGERVAGLPMFRGQPGSEMQMKKMYEELEASFAPMQQHIATITLSPRYAWEVTLENGTQLILGTEQVRQRAERFVSVYPYSLGVLQEKAKRIDLRYRDGFAAYLPKGSA